MRQDRDLTFNGTRLVADVGLIYSSFTETLPEPRTIYVNVPGGFPVDVSEALGGIAYGNGKHVLTFLLYASSEAERLEKKARIIALLHGNRASYTLSWEEGTYTGRAVVAFEHKWDDVDVVTVTITHDPIRTSTVSYYVYPIATYTSATYAQVYDYLKGAQSYSVSVRTYQSGQAKLGSKSTVTIDNTTVDLGSVSSTGGDSVPLYVRVTDWWVGELNASGRLILNPTHFPNPTDGEVTTDSDWTRSGTNLACSNYDAKQRAYVTVTKKGY